MNNLKVSVVVAAAVALVAGCGHKNEQSSLPPEQVLAGNAIVAPQQSVLDAHNAAPSMVGTTTVVPANQASAAATEPSSLELTGHAAEKPNDKDVQQALKNAGLYHGPIDGNIGPKTKKAIREFQEQNKLNADGKVGPRTWKKLLTYLHSAPGAEAGPNEVSN